MLRTRHLIIGLLAASISLGLHSGGVALGAPTPPSPGSGVWHNGFTVTPPSDPYLMAFHTCSVGADCENPSNHLIRLASSPNGSTWTQLPGWQTYVGSVPDVIRRGNTLYLSGGGISTIDLTSGKVTNHAFTVRDAQGADAMPRDMSFAGQLPDGRFVVVYVPSMQAIDMNSNARTILLATEDAGSDGTAYTYSGTAITINKAGLPVIGEPTDPDIFFNGTRWVLYVSLGANLLAYTSTSVNGPYELATQALVSANSGGVGTAMMSMDGSSLLNYVNSGPSRNSQSVYLAQSSPTPALIPATSWQAVLTPAMFGTATAESPGVAQNTAGITCSGCGSSSSSAAKDTAGKAGSRCSKKGATGIYQGRAMVCKRVKGKLVWAQTG